MISKSEQERTEIILKNVLEPIEIKNWAGKRPSLVQSTNHISPFLLEDPDQKQKKIIAKTDERALLISN